VGLFCRPSRTPAGCPPLEKGCVFDDLSAATRRFAKRTRDTLGGSVLQARAEAGRMSSSGTPGEGREGVGRPAVDNWLTSTSKGRAWDQTHYHRSPRDDLPNEPETPSVGLFCRPSQCRPHDLRYFGEARAGANRPGMSSQSVGLFGGTEPPASGTARPLVFNLILLNEPEMPGFVEVAAFASFPRRGAGEHPPDARPGKLLVSILFRSRGCSPEESTETAPEGSKQYAVGSTQKVIGDRQSPQPQRGWACVASVLLAGSGATGRGTRRPVPAGHGPPTHRRPSGIPWGGR